jgi:sugar lactone lactonase YvrE
MKTPIEIIDPNFYSLISPLAVLEKIPGDFIFTEGPVWDSSRNCLYFSDIPASTIYQYSEKDGLSIYRKPSFFANGLTLTKNFELISCEHQRRAVSIQRKDHIEIICDHFQGKKLNSPNDVIQASDGSILFTDPIYGLRDGQGGPAIRELPFQGVFRLQTGENEPILISDDFERPNGLALNKDESRLFVDDSVRQHIRVFDVGNEWQITGGSVFANLHGDLPGRPDGMKIDFHGNIFSTGSGGIWVFNSMGKLLGKIYFSEKISNLAWGDEDHHSLFITGSKCLYRLRCLTSGIFPTD